MKKKKTNNSDQSIVYIPLDRNPEFNADAIPPLIPDNEELQDLIVDPEEWSALDNDEDERKNDSED